MPSFPVSTANLLPSTNEEALTLKQHFMDVTFFNFRFAFVNEKKKKKERKNELHLHLVQMITCERNLILSSNFCPMSKWLDFIMFFTLFQCRKKLFGKPAILSKTAAVAQYVLGFTLQTRKCGEVKVTGMAVLL